MPLTCEEATCMPICVHLLSYFYKVVAESQATASPAKSCLPGLQCESIAPVYRLMACPLKLYYCQTILLCFSGNTFFFDSTSHLRLGFLDDLKKLMFSMTTFTCLSLFLLL